MISTQAIIHKLNAAGSLNPPNKTNIGMANSGVTASEYGNAYQHTTILTINKTSAFTLADNAAKGVGYLLYTLPAGAIIMNNAYMALQVDNAEHTANNTAELGLGTTIASGAVSVLSGTAAFENVLTGLASYGLSTVGINMATSKAADGDAGLLIPAANAHTVYANLASTWANTAGVDLDADLTGFVILNWTFLV